MSGVFADYVLINILNVILNVCVFRCSWHVAVLEKSVEVLDRLVKAAGIFIDIMALVEERSWQFRDIQDIFDTMSCIKN